MCIMRLPNGGLGQSAEGHHTAKEVGLVVARNGRTRSLQTLRKSSNPCGPPPAPWPLEPKPARALSHSLFI